MIISFIVAMGRNRVIGSKNTLPWKLPADMKRFRDITMGKPIIMGRKTFMSIGHALPDRLNIVMTRDQSFHANGCIVACSCEDALQKAGNAEEVVIIGGSSLFEQFLSRAERIYLTVIDHDFKGDVFFPEYDARDWQEVEHRTFAPDAKNKYAYTFITLRRK